MRIMTLRHASISIGTIVSLLVMWNMHLPHELYAGDTTGGCFECDSCDFQLCSEYDSMCGGGGSTCYGSWGYVDADCTWLFWDDPPGAWLHHFDCSGAYPCYTYKSCNTCPY